MALVNDPATTFDLLNDPVDEGGAGLYRNAARNIVDLRPFERLEDLDAVPFVGPATCNALLRQACEVEDRCDERDCDPARFESRPARTRYDSECEAALLRLLDATPGPSDAVVLTDAANRCETLTPRQQQAFDLVAAEYGSTPEMFSSDFGEFSIEVFSTDADDEVVLVHVIEEQNFMPFHLVFQDDALAAVWSTDGLSAGAQWYCGGAGEPADAPEDFCIGALTDSAAWCDPSTATRREYAVAVGEAREDFIGLDAAAVVVYADDHGLGDDVEVAVQANSCGDQAAFVTVSADGGSQSTLHVVDSARGLGRTILTTTTEGRTAIDCRTPNG
jgi:hypothetical protein